MVARRRARRQETAPAPAVFRQPRLTYRPIEVLDAGRVEAIHEASLRVLRDTGMKVLSDEARAIYAAHGGKVDGQLVRFDPAMVMEKVALAPAEFTLAARNPEKNLRIGGNAITFCTVGGPAFVSDLDKGRRSGTQAEVEDYIRLIHSYDVLHQEGGGPFEALDIPQDRRYLDLYLAEITLTDKNWVPWTLGRVRVRDALEMMALALGCPKEELIERPVFAGVINTNSPLMLDKPMADGLIEMATWGQANIITPFTLAGAMAPVTLAGALTLQNAEALAGIVLTQCVRPGVPVVYGGFTTNVDMRSGSPAFGTPEYVQAAQMGGQMARRYGLPFRSSSATAANACDAQAAWESMMSLWGAVTGRANIVMHSAGWLNGGLTASFEKLVMDAETLSMMARWMEAPEVDVASLAEEAIAAVGHGGHFFGAAHTLERYRTAFWEPEVSDWTNYEAWDRAGRVMAPERANAVWKRRLAEYEPPPLDDGAREAITDYAARRKREIDAGIDIPDA